MGVSMELNPALTPASEGEVVDDGARDALWASARPLLLAARVLGLAPLRLARPGAGPGPLAQASRAWQVYSLALAALTSAWAVREVVVGVTSTWPGLPASLVVPDALNIAFLAATALVALLAAAVRPQGLAHILNSLPALDAALGADGRLLTRSSYFRIWAPAVGALFIMATLGTLDCFVWDAIFLTRLAVQVVIVAEDAVFLGLVLSLKRCLRRTNRLLEERFRGPPPLIAPSLFYPAGRTSTASAALATRARVDALADHINTVFGPPLLLELTAVPVGAVCCVYVALDALDVPTQVGGPGASRTIVRAETLLLGAVAGLLWAAFRAAKLIALTATCQTTVNESARTASLVQHALLSDETAFEVGETAALRLLSQQLLLRPLRFTAAGFFTIDCSLVYNFTGAVTTYLVVLVQLQRA